MPPSAHSPGPGPGTWLSALQRAHHPHTGRSSSRHVFGCCLRSIKFSGDKTGTCHACTWPCLPTYLPAHPPMVAARQYRCWGGSGLLWKQPVKAGSLFPFGLVPTGRWQCQGCSRRAGSVTYQLRLSFYGFHTKILTLFRGATGHSTFPSRLPVVFALPALSGRECHPWLVTMCTQAQPGTG